MATTPTPYPSFDGTRREAFTFPPSPSFEGDPR
jgi:hypothetical protein